MKPSPARWHLRETFKRGNMMIRLFCDETPGLHEHEWYKSIYDFYTIEGALALAKHLRMEVVAEGIETHEQVEFLMRTGCDLIQGFYFAKPMPVSEFETLPRQFIRAR